MWKFLLGAAAGAAGMYYGSDAVRDNFQQTADNLEKIEKSKQHIEMLTEDMLIEWIHNGELIDKLAQREYRLKVEYNQVLDPKVWEQARILDAQYRASR